VRRSLVLLALPSILAAAQPSVRELTLKTPDGYLLKGTLTLPSGHGRCAAVILAHQFQSDRSGWAPLAEQLRGRGIATLALDMRGHGKSTERNKENVAVGTDFAESAKRVGFEQMPHDLELAAAWLRKQPGIDGRRVALAGSSVGAFSVILASPRIHPAAVLALSPAGNSAFGPEAEAHLKSAVRHARSAVFALAAEEDADAWQNCKALSGLPGVYAKGVEGKAHGFEFLAPQGDTMAVFLGEYLRKRVSSKPKGEAKGEPATSAQAEPKPEPRPEPKAPIAPKPAPKNPAK